VSADEQVPVTVLRIRAERAAAGLEPTIRSLAVYALLAAVIDANERTTAPK
jgi:hypothetical protein